MNVFCKEWAIIQGSKEYENWRYVLETMNARYMGLYSAVYGGVLWFDAAAYGFCLLKVRAGAFMKSWAVGAGPADG